VGPRHGRWGLATAAAEALGYLGLQRGLQHRPDDLLQRPDLTDQADVGCRTVLPLGKEHCRCRCCCASGDSQSSPDSRADRLYGTTIRTRHPPRCSEHVTVIERFARCIGGHLDQQWSVQHVATGGWRGATDAKHAGLT
jgi:hypothetical protein